VVEYRHRRSGAEDKVALKDAVAFLRKRMADQAAAA
jgi:hypothetical protein